MRENKYDVIIIGSGIGGLSAGSILSQFYGKKVLVLEKHGKIGGFTHVFKRKAKFQWDVGVHYVGNLASGSQNRKLFDLVTGSNLQWQKLPDPYDVFLYPGFTFRARSGKDNFFNDLLGSFPSEKKALENYFKDLNKANEWFSRYAISGALPRFLNPAKTLFQKLGSGLARMTTKQYLDMNFSDPKLKALLTSQWGDYGLPPSKSAFVMHAIVVQHYFEGGWYPIGGGQKIADSIRPLIERNGGQLLNRHAVSEIMVKNKKAIGVRVLAGKDAPFEEKEFFAEKIISNTGAYNTFCKLLPDKTGLAIRDEVSNFPKGTSNLTLFIGLKNDPREAGFQGGNYWLTNSFDHDQLFDQKNKILTGEASHCFLSFSSLKDPQAENHTAEIIAFVDYEPFSAWADKPWKNRGEDYETLKEHIAQALIHFVDDRFPGFKDLIEYYELGTPLTTEHYTGHRLGNIYGIPGIPERFNMNWIQHRTPVKNLYLTGADTASPGIYASMMSGILAAPIAMGKPLDIIKIFNRAKK